MRLVGRVSRVTVFLSESDSYRHRPLYAEIVQRAHRAGLAGASVFRGVEGFGASHHLHTERIVSLSEDLPLLVVLVDTPEKIAAFLPELDLVVRDGLVVLDEVEAVPPTGADQRPQ